MSNLPEGVTPAMIDRAFPDASDDWDGPFLCSHEDAIDAAWNAAEVAARYDDPESDPEVARLLEAPVELPLDLVEGVSVSYAETYVAVQWTCSVCGDVHEEEHEPEGPDPDRDRD